MCCEAFRIRDDPTIQIMERPEMLSLYIRQEFGNKESKSDMNDMHAERSPIQIQVYFTYIVMPKFCLT